MDRLQHVLSSVLARSDIALPKSILKVYADELLRPLWDDITTNGWEKEGDTRGGKRLLFILRLQANSAVMAALKGVLGTVDVTEKSFIKRFYTCIRVSIALGLH